MKPQDLEAIEQYLAGQLPEEKAKALEELLQSDEKLKAQFEQTKTLIAGIRYSGRISALNELKQLENSLPEIKIRHKYMLLKHLSNYKYLAAASVLFSVLTLLFFLLKNGQKTDCIALYKENFEPYPNVAYPVTRFDEQSLTLIQKAFVEYDKNRYSNAIGLFKSIPNYSSNQTIVFYLSMSYMGNDDTKQATLLLLSILDQNPALNDKIKWYLGLCYLKDNKTSTARSYFKDLIDTNSSYAQKAIRILKKIK